MVDVLRLIVKILILFTFLRVIATFYELTQSLKLDAFGLIEFLSLIRMLLSQWLTVFSICERSLGFRFIRIVLWLLAFLRLIIYSDCEFQL